MTTDFDVRLIVKDVCRFALAHMYVTVLILLFLDICFATSGLVLFQFQYLLSYLV